MQLDCANKHVSGIGDRNTRHLLVSALGVVKWYCISVFQDRPVNLRSTAVAVVVTGEMPHVWENVIIIRSTVVAVVITGELPHSWENIIVIRSTVVAIVIAGEMPHCWENIVIIRSTVVAVVIAGEMPHLWEKTSSSQLRLLL